MKSLTICGANGKSTVLTKRFKSQNQPNSHEGRLRKIHLDQVTATPVTILKAEVGNAQRVLVSNEPVTDFLVAPGPGNKSFTCDLD